MASSGRSTREAGDVPDGALLRFALPPGAWAESIPPVPAGARATVTFSNEHAEAEHGDALRLLGYAVIGVLAPRDSRLPAGRDADGGGPAPDSAELLISREVLDRHSTWFRSLLSQSTQAFDLSLGPALAALQDRWRPHLAARQRQRPHCPTPI